MISILIITYNRPADLIDLLQCINRLYDDVNKEIIYEVNILNNQSTVGYDSVEDYVKNKLRFKHNYIVAEENLGVAKGRNFLAEKSNTELLLFLDDDIYFEPFDPILLLEINTGNLFKVNNTAIITYDIRYFDNGQIQPSAFPHKKFKQIIGENCFLTYYFTGAAHILKRSVFIECGLYPTDFFYGMEEYDLSYRVLDKGFSIGYSNSITFLHKESPLGRKPKNEQVRMMWVNKCKVAYRYLPTKYFYSTAVMWSLEYFKKAGVDMKGWLKGWKQVSLIPKTQQRTTIQKLALKYLKRVQARLWY